MKFIEFILLKIIEILNPYELASNGRGLLATTTGALGGELIKEIPSKVVFEVHFLQYFIWIITLIVGILTIIGFFLKQYDLYKEGHISIFLIKNLFKRKNKIC